LLEFAYQWTGNRVHEWIGFVILALFLVHNALNWQWYRALIQGQYRARRLASTIANLLVLAVALMLMASGLLNSHMLFAIFKMDWDLPVRQLHTAAAYWFLIFMSVHLGMYWKMILAEIGKRAGITSASRMRTMALRTLSALIVAYGIHASFERNIGAKLTAYYSFDYWDSDQAIVEFFSGYLAIMGVYICLTHYALKLFRKRGQLVKQPGI
jgi:hypothetical protein